MNRFDWTQTPLIDSLNQYYHKSPVSFHVPGHKKGAGCSSLQKEFFDKNIFTIDATELPGLDNLNEPRGVIGRAQKLAARLYGSKNAFFLVNGSSCGIHAMIMSTCFPGDKIIVSRDIHRSIMAGIIQAGAVPVYIEPQIHEKLAIPMGIPVPAIEEALRDNPDASCVLLPNPNYYGITSELKSIARVVHSHGKVLLVDEACGYHLAFSLEFPPSAVEAGADICVQSVHKMGSSLTQTSILHVISDRIDVGRLKSCLKMIGTSSPSYILMASLDGARYHMEVNKERVVGEMTSNCHYLKSLLQGEEDIINSGYFIQCGGHKYKTDMTKTVISLRCCGLTGIEAALYLRTSYGIEVELEDLYNILVVITNGNTKKEIDGLVGALQKIIAGKGCSGNSRHKNALRIMHMYKRPVMPRMAMPPREAMLGRHHKFVPLLEAEGEICADIICPYPPGVPLICPGEIIEEDMVQYLNRQISEGLTMEGLHGKHEKDGKWYVKVLDF